MKTFPTPRIPAHIKRLGATKVNRAIAAGVFLVSFKIDDSVGYDQPGHGSEVCNALREHFAEARVSWTGEQCKAIVVDFRPQS